MNDRRLKRDDDDEAGMDFELRTHVRRKKMGLNSPSSLDNPRIKESHEQVHQPLNRNPYNVIYESSCKLHPGGSYQGHFNVPHPYAANKYNNHHYEGDSRFPNYCNDSYYAKGNTPPSTPLSMPPSLQYSQPSSPRVYFQKPTFPHQGTPLSPLPSPPLSVTSVQPSLSPAASATGSLSNLAPRIVRPTSQGTMPADINRNPPPSPKVSEINVFLKNQVMVCLEVEDIQSVTCRELIGMILDEPEVGLPREAEDIFALWLVSPLFEVQLKPDHKPLYVLRKWPELISKYTTASAEEQENDMPFLSFQRDVFYSKKNEMRILGNTVMVELLYEEAKRNVLSGRYPCDQANAERLAGMQTRIELGKFDQDIHTPAFFKARLDSFLPLYACKSKRTKFFNFGSKTGIEYKLLLLFRGLQDDVSQHAIMMQYLDFCWGLPYYGSAFFIGQLEKPATGLAALIGYQDMPVNVAINSEGVSIISPTEGEVLLGLQYKDLSWDSARPDQENNPDCLPCLFLQFQVLERGQKVFKVLQVFSKQAILMDAIISSFVRAIRRRSWDRDEVDDSSATTPGDCTPDADDAQTPLTTSSLYGSSSNDTDTSLPSKLQRLSLATFNEDGDCIKLMGSWAFR